MLCCCRRLNLNLTTKRFSFSFVYFCWLMTHETSSFFFAILFFYIIDKKPNTLLSLGVVACYIIFFLDNNFTRLLAIDNIFINYYHNFEIPIFHLNHNLSLLYHLILFSTTIILLYSSIGLWCVVMYLMCMFFLLEELKSLIVNILIFFKPNKTDFLHLWLV